MFPDFVQNLRGNTSIWIDSKLADSPFVDRLADVDRLLTDPACEIIKDQKKVTVGRLSVLIADAPKVIFIKRYNPFSLRYRLTSLFLRSGALRALRGATILRALDIPTAVPIAAVEHHRWGVVAKSFFISEEITGGKTADRYWRDDLRLLTGAVGRKRRREFLIRLGQLFHALHGRQIYHNDLKDANILAVAKGEVTSFFLLDLEGVRRLRRLSDKRRIKNLVQLHRTLGRYLRATDKLVFLKNYLPEKFFDRKVKRGLVETVLRKSKQLDRSKAVRSPRDFA